MPRRKLNISPSLSWPGPPDRAKRGRRTSFTSGPSMGALSEASPGWPAFAGHDNIFCVVR